MFSQAKPKYILLNLLAVLGSLLCVADGAGRLRIKRRRPVVEMGLAAIRSIGGPFVTFKILRKEGDDVNLTGGEEVKNDVEKETSEDVRIFIDSDVSRHG
jgi:hypothetical protein